MTENAWTPDQFRAYGSFMYAHTALIREMERKLRDDYGLLLTWYEVLVMLQEAPGNRLPHGGLAGGIILSPSGITRVVDRMVKEGLVTREQASDDRRRSYVKMTRKGRKALDAAGPVHSAQVYELFGRHLRAEEAPAVVAFLDRILTDEDREKIRRKIGLYSDESD